MAWRNTMERLETLLASGPDKQVDGLSRSDYIDCTILVAGGVYVAFFV